MDGSVRKEGRESSSWPPHEPNEQELGAAPGTGEADAVSCAPVCKPTLDSGTYVMRESTPRVPPTMGIRPGSETMLLLQVFLAWYSS